MAGRKIFVGTLPDGVHESVLWDEFGKFGRVEDVHLKANCEPGRQWAFVTFENSQQAQAAKEATDRILCIDGHDKPVEVMIAKNQGKFGQAHETPQSLSMVGFGSSSSAGPKKIFVGSLPDSITEEALRVEFDKFGQITDVFLKVGCSAGKQWAFVTYSSGAEAQSAKDHTDNKLTFPGASKACEVMLARNQGMNGSEPLNGSASGGYGEIQGPTKIFVGSLPDSITDSILRREFSKFGQIVDVYLKTGCETGKNWGFITFATHDQAQQAKDSTDRILVVPGGTTPCETMFAKNQGKNGQDPLSGGPASASQPPPPPGAPPMCPWKQYFNNTGIPYYHNHATGQTQWECPPEFQLQALQQMQAQHFHAASFHNAFYGPMYGLPPPRFGPY